MKIESLESFKHDIIRFEDDYRTYMRYENGYWAEIDNDDKSIEYSVRHYDIEELEKTYQNYLIWQKYG